MVDKVETGARAVGPMREPDAGADSLTLQRVFAALANDSRRTILAILHNSGGCMTSGQIAGHFTTSWQTISRHLKVLEEAGLISYERRGRDRAYTIERGFLPGAAGQWLNRFGQEDLPSPDEGWTPGGPGEPASA